MLTSFEICAGAGGQALGLEQAGFSHIGLLEIDNYACSTLHLNRPSWMVHEQDLKTFNGNALKGIDLLSGGVPCPPFSKAGKQEGEQDERNLFPEAVRLVDEIRPKAVMLENVRGILDSIFDEYRQSIINDLKKLGYVVEWKLLNASDYGVSQLRPRVVFVAVRKDIVHHFEWPKPSECPLLTVGELLYDLMAGNGWFIAPKWKLWANDIAPTLVGGSKKHGGPDLGPTRAKRAWASIGVDGYGLADQAPEPNFVGLPRLTARMTARIQGFPDDWKFYGKKTAAYRQIGNAFPPPVAKAIGRQIRYCLEAASRERIFSI
jgi:DNA (cytosine-5)-methyltransferase 1